MSKNYLGLTGLTKVFTLIKGLFDGLATVAKTGSYNDLTDKPSVPGGENYVLKAGDTMSGCLSITSTGNNFTEGVRINTASNGFFTLLLGGSGNSGTRDGAFWIGGNNTYYPRILFVSHNGSNAGNTYFHASGATDQSPKLHLPSGSIASGDYDAVNGDAVYGYIASGHKDLDSHNANNSLKNGFYYYTSNGPATSLGASTNDGALYVQRYNDSWVAQIAQDYRNGRLFVRGKNNGTWQSWLRVALTSEVDAKTFIKDYNNSTPTYFGYSTSGMAQSAATWLAAWDASVSGQYRLRAVRQDSLRVAYAVNATNAVNADYASESYSSTFSGSATNAGKLLAGKTSMEVQDASLAQRLVLQNDYNLVLYKNGGAVWATNTSSRRFKHNIQSMTEERAKKILQIRPVTFDWNDGQPVTTQKCDNAGVIAEEVSQIIPDVVVFEQYDNDPNTRIERRVEYERFTPYLIKMIQMQQKQIDALTKRVEELEARV